jgi:predicted MPP superfamily phosphohydrolase
MTDIHLNFVSNTKTMFAEVGGRDLFLNAIRDSLPDALFLTGDIAEGPSLPKFLDMLSEIAPTYFVMGNHDYYNSSIKKMHKWASHVTRSDKPMFWMNAAGVVPLTEKTAVVGVDGWADAHYGNPETSKVALNDWFAIKELLFRMPHSIETHLERRIPALRALGYAEATRLRPALLEALESFQTVYVLTHVPPWDTATWHEGAHSDPDWLPWFSCKAVGDVIEECAAKYPDKKVTVLCGHTHGSGHCERMPNVECFTGGAAYRYPEIQKTLEID